jgi:DNA-directed RNA polymerase specialized sigma24 family protein
VAALYIVMSRLDQSETMLVLLAQQSDVVAFEELLRRLHGPLRQYVTRMVGGSDADDVLQDAAIRFMATSAFFASRRCSVHGPSALPAESRSHI